MKIENNYQNQINAWLICVNALDAIRHCYIENRHESDKEAEDAYYTLLACLNRWNEEIKEMPF